jgi:hypothetical protein
MGFVLVLGFGSVWDWVKLILRGCILCMKRVERTWKSSRACQLTLDGKYQGRMFDIEAIEVLGCTILYYYRRQSWLSPVELTMTMTCQLC